ALPHPARRRRHGSPTTSPPAIVDSARYTSGGIDSRTNRTDPSHNRKLQPPGWRERKPLTKSRPEALVPVGSLPKTGGVKQGRARIGAPRGSGGRPTCAAPANPDPYHGGAASPQPAALHDCSMIAGCPVNGSVAGWLGSARLRTVRPAEPPAASPMA